MVDLRMTVTIRKLSNDEEKFVIEIARESWLWTYRDIYSEEFINNWIEENYTPESIRNEILRSQSGDDILFLGIFNDYDCLGFIEFKKAFPNAELLRFYLKPEKTHFGYGSRLLESAEDILVEEGFKKFTLYVHELNDIAISFYLKHGFKKSSIQDEDVIMEKIVE